MIRRLAVIAAVSGGSVFASGQAQAHIKLTKPASWIQENATGDPQKAGPCGPAAGQGTETKEVTTYTEGQEITVEWTETVNHEGHFRIALAKDRGELKDPKITGACQSAEISDPPQYPIIADGLFAVKTDDGKRMFSQKVKLPAGVTCDNCTLQVLQFMTPHPVPCLYYHCANVKIIAAGAAGGGGVGAAGVGTAAGSVGTSSAGAGASSAAGTAGGAGTGGPVPVDPGGADDGCSATHSPHEQNGTLACLFGLGLVMAGRRRRNASALAT
jgi:hypothetical protein